MDEMHDLNDMYMFAKVIEHGGYSAASRALGIATSKLSRRVSELERRLGVHLVNRTTRSTRFQTPVRPSIDTAWPWLERPRRHGRRSRGPDLLHRDLFASAAP